MSVFRRSLIMIKLAVKGLVVSFYDGVMTLNKKGRRNKTYQDNDSLILSPPVSQQANNQEQQ